MLQLYPTKSVTLRTLDISADKQLPYMPISEENPCLGRRGTRITLDQPEIFLIQVRAMLRANVSTGNLSILLPMITSIEEIDEAKRLIDRVVREVEEVLGYEIPKTKISLMLKVPSIIFLIPSMATRIDFISIGTNDLTQYLLAVDRNNTRVASLYDSLHPAMLRVLKLIAEQGKAAGLQVCLCGELAGDYMGALLLGRHGLSQSQHEWPQRGVHQIHAAAHYVIGCRSAGAACIEWRNDERSGPLGGGIYGA